jgi:hypothetical protein
VGVLHANAVPASSASGISIMVEANPLHVLAGGTGCCWPCSNQSKSHRSHFEGNTRLCKRGKQKSAGIVQGEDTTWSQILLIRFVCADTRRISWLAVLVENNQSTKFNYDRGTRLVAIPGPGQ